MMATRFDLLAFDYRGMGRSAPVSEPYAMADVAADVEALLDSVGWDATAVAGLSFGGMVAQEFAVTFPDRVTRLALLCTSPGADFASYPLDRLASMPDAQRARLAMELCDRRWTPDWLAAHPDQVAFAAAMAGDAATESPAHATGRMLQLQARKGHDVLDRLHRITCPTFVASGRYDDIAPVVNGQAIAERVPGAEFHVYDGGHPFVMQDPAAWPDVEAFLFA